MQQTVLKVTIDTTSLALCEMYSNGKITEGERTTKLAVLMGDGELETDLPRQ